MFVYLNDKGEKAYTNWAINKSKYLESGWDSHNSSTSDEKDQLDDWNSDW